MAGSPVEDMVSCVALVAYGLTDGAQCWLSQTREGFHAVKERVDDIHILERDTLTTAGSTTPQCHNVYHQLKNHSGVFLVKEFECTINKYLWYIIL